MHLALERRTERSALVAIVSPLIAIALTLATMSALFALLGKNPVAALGVYFIDPLTDAYTLEEIADRIAVIFHGTLSAPVDRATATRERLGLMMGGSRTDDLAATESTYAPGA